MLLFLAAIGVSWSAVAVSFHAHSEGSFTSQGIPPEDVSVQIDHPSVQAILGGLPFSFASLMAEETVRFPQGALPEIVDGHFKFTAAGGDTLWGTFTATMFPTDNQYVSLAVGPFAVTGGTGRFDGAAGGGGLNAMIAFTSLSDGLSTIDWEGNLQLNGAVPETGTALLLFALGGISLIASRRQLR